MSETRMCPECGAELPAGDPRPVCVACLLKRGLESNTAGYTEGKPTARWTPPRVEELAERFPELNISRLIGRGGMGAVYEARQKNLDRVVALKILPPEMATDVAFKERFAREAQAMARLNHPHIVTIHEFGERAGWYFFVMEFVDGMNLRGLLDSGHVSPKEALAIVPQICEALQYAHDQGIVHRDIKPENILLNKQGQVKIADFGLAKLMGRSVSGTTEKVMGTPQYMAPEQIERPAEVDHRADIYSLGVVFYQMLTGELPVGRFEKPSQLVRVDVRLDEVVLRALEREPEKRYQQVSEVKTEVETISGTPAGAASGPANPAQEPGHAASGFGGHESPAFGSAGAHFSRTAIVGAAWAAWFLATMPLWLWHELKTHEFETFGPFGSAFGAFVFFVFELPMFTAPFGATLMGLISLTQIRHSAGRLHGSGVALCDALLFPLLALDALTAWWIYLLIDGLARHAHPEGAAANFQGVLTIAVPVAVALDAILIWLAWRAANKLLKGTGPTVPKRNERVGLGRTALCLSILGLLVELAFFVNLVLGSWHASAAIVIPLSMVTLMVLLAALILGIIARQRWTARIAIVLAATAILWPVLHLRTLSTPAVATTEPERPSRDLGFGPVVELSPRIINTDAVPTQFPLTECFINFRSGRLVPMPENLAALCEKGGQDDPNVNDWLKREIHGYFEGISHPILAGGYDMDGFLATPADNVAWQTITTQQLRGKLDAFEKALPPDNVQAEADGRSMDPKDHYPATFLFRTRDGDDGILQMLGYDTTRSRMKIRYKLMKQRAIGQVTELSPRILSDGEHPDTAPATSASQPAAGGYLKIGVPPVMSGTQPGSAAARIKLEAAEAALREAEAQQKIGRISPGEYLRVKAARNIAAAELAGDAAKVAQARFEAAADHLRIAQGLQDAGRISPEEFRQIQIDFDRAAATTQPAATGGSSDAAATKPSPPR